MTADERIKMLLGELQVQNAILQSQVETLTARVAELTPTPPPENEQQS